MPSFSTRRILNDFPNLPFHLWNMAPLTSKDDSGSNRNAGLRNGIPAGPEGLATIPT